MSLVFGDFVAVPAALVGCEAPGGFVRDSDLFALLGEGGVWPDIYHEREEVAWGEGITGVEFLRAESA